jgi:hypothetical protein
MEKITLPEILPGLLDLNSLNAKIKKKEIQLDWSQVTKVQRGDLIRLLAGVELESPDFVQDILGLDAEKINPVVLELLLETINPQDPTPYQIREEIQAAIYRDLLGPVNGPNEEVLEPSNLLDRYLLGVIAPRIRQKDDQENKDDESMPTLENETEDGNSEASVALANSLFPSSFGLTFCVQPQVKAVQIKALWGYYQRVDSQIYFNENGAPKKVWQRHPVQGVKKLTLDHPREEDWFVDLNEAPEVFARIKIRRSAQKEWIITAFLVNGQSEAKEYKSSSWLFQPELIIDSADSDFPFPFVRKPLVKVPQLDFQTQQDIEQMNLLYRKQIEFASGHGVSIEVEQETENQVKSLKTSFIPRYEVPASDFPDEAKIPELSGLVLDMKKLSQADSTQLLSYLAPLPKAYQAWLKEQEKLLEHLEQHKKAGQRSIHNCREALARLDQGIKLVTQDEDALTSFRLMNQAMALQREHSLFSEAIRKGEKLQISDFNKSKFHSWRLFQLAFILINLPGLSDVHHQDRNICDLLWFATGGGKTEAYLGLTAYSLLTRRLQKNLGDRDGQNGVAVIMRYTLRLLTLQQFQRATTLICALEVIRQEKPQQWGKEPFRIGLWVGQNTTPNRTEQSSEYLKSIATRGPTRGTGSPHQLTNCPWCGTKIEATHNLKVESYAKGRGRTLVYCNDPTDQCPFTTQNSPSEGLPIVVVDEEIYRLLPSLLIATVDKFARMPWQGEVQMLFGQVNGRCERHGFRSSDLKDENSHRDTGDLPAAITRSHLPLRPPDLIIQDELHLISGPLGTLVGIYETAVEELSSWQVEGKKVRTKVIASTATIRQASSQIQAIFNRGVEIFPPQVLNIEDNFFSYTVDPSPERPGRRYIGICAPGRRMKATVIRVYLAALAAGEYLYQKYGERIDPWMTLVGYFNSLKELGSTRRLVDDDIRTRLARMSERDLCNRKINSFDELTSRKDATEIPLLLDRLEMPFNPEQSVRKAEQRKKKEKVTIADPLDIILATNMLSVGVDVKRLGLMVVCGQPKSTSEYIQATSRVGRSHPGLVITIYNWARPRDLSYYESFVHYHATFYKQVEALSVTPFSYGALDRALGALLVSLIRLKGNEFNANESAGLLTGDHLFVKSAIDTILNRAKTSQPKEVCDYIQQELDRLLNHWLEEANNRPGGASLNYQSKAGTSIALLKAAGTVNGKEFACLNSLRNVEPTSGLILSSLPPNDDPKRKVQPF